MPQFLTWPRRVPIPVWVFLLSIVLSAVTLAILKPSDFASTGDFSHISSDYGVPAQELIDGRDYASFRFPPAMPIALAALYRIAHTLGVSDRALVAGWIVLLVAAESVLLYGIIRALWPKTLSVIAIGLWLFYPPALYLVGYVGSEQLFNVGLFASVLLFIHAQSMTSRRQLVALFASGCFAALAMLTRSVGIGLFIILPLVYVWKPPSRPVWPGIVALLLGMIVLVLPWEIYAYTRTHVIVPLSLGGPGAMIDGATYAVDPKDHRNIPITDADRALQLDFYKIPRGQITTLSQIGDFFVTQFRERPGAVVEHFAAKFVNVWYATDGSRLGSAFLLVQAPYIALFAVSLVLGFRQDRRRRRMTLLVTLFGLYLLGMTVLMVPLLRYILPAIGLTFALVPATIEAASAAIRRRHSAALLATVEKAADSG